MRYRATMNGKHRGRQNEGVCAMPDYANVNGWDAGVRVEPDHAARADTFRVYMTGGSHDAHGRRHVGTVTDTPDGPAWTSADRITSPVTGVTRNAGYTVRAVIHVNDASPGILATWLVACEDADRGAWVTWNAYEEDGRLSYDGGHYFHSADARLNRRYAMADLAERAGTMPLMAQHIANLMTSRPDVTAAETRVAKTLRNWAG